MRSSDFVMPITYRAVVLNWRFLRLYSLPNFVAISRDIATHGSYAYIWFTRKMPDLLILKLMFSFVDCMRNLPIIVYKKPPIKNDSPIVVIRILNIVTTLWTYDQNMWSIISHVTYHNLITILCHSIGCHKFVCLTFKSQ